MRAAQMLALLESMMETGEIRADKANVYTTDTGGNILCPVYSVEVDLDGDVRIVMESNIL